MGDRIKLFSNNPDDDRKDFDRNIFYELQWNPESELQRSHPDTTALHAELQFNRSGSFRYYFVLESAPDVTRGSGYFISDPVLKIGHDGRLPINAVQTQTVLSKCLGLFKSWKERLLVSKKSGYNVIHFTPIQELGDSNSAYSLKDQLRLNPSFGEDVTFEHVKQLLQDMRTEWSVLSLTDIVLNHTANESPWIKEHPEAGFNMVNSPHLRPAFLLDRVLHHLTLDISLGKWTPRGLTQVSHERDLDQIRNILWTHYLPSVNIHEMFQINVPVAVQEFQKRLEKDDTLRYFDAQTISVVQDALFRRSACQVDFEKLKCCDTSREKDIGEICDIFRKELEDWNRRIMDQVNDHLRAAVDNVMSAIRYERLQPDGPKIQEISVSKPLITPYFSFYGPDLDLVREEEMMWNPATGCHFLAHNGWVMNSDPLRNFADVGSNVYLRRELIAWGDSVKLRYGSCPDDCPFLWELMRKYVEKTAEMFDGIRLDNCHSTPLQVAEYLIDAARRVRPDLYIIAELFTSSQDLDNIFVNRLGINSLIRESMACHDSHELGRLVYRYGGDPVGAFSKPSFRPLQPSIAHAIFFDMTHDNESCIQKRSPYDLLASSAVISMSACATGSNRGYDELVPHHIHVVRENRVYRGWNDTPTDSRDPNHGNSGNDSASYASGIIFAKSLLNELHSRLCLEGYSEIYVDQVDSNVIAVTRFNPVNHKSVVLVARTCFSKQEPAITGFIRNITIAGKINVILFEGRMTGDADSYSADESFINGIDNFLADVKQMIPVEKSALVTITTDQTGVNQVKFEKFPPSSIIAFDVCLDGNHLEALSSFRGTVNQMHSPALLSSIDSLDLLDLNYLLFRNESEEKDEFPDGGTYSVPAFAGFNYCGLAGNHRDILSVMKEFFVESGNQFSLLLLFSGVIRTHVLLEGYQIQE